MTRDLVAATAITKSYGNAPAIGAVSISCAAGEVVAVVGASGSGKSTLLLCLAGILVPDQGEVWLGDQRIDQMSDSHRSGLRSTDVGVVFQFGNLVPELTAAENVCLPLLLNGIRRRSAAKQAYEALDRFGIGHLADRNPHMMSGGEAQRVALARVFVTGPRAVFADEPTGALDSVSGDAVTTALVGLARENGAAVVVATHNDAVANAADRVVLMHDGAASAVDR